MERIQTRVGKVAVHIAGPETGPPLVLLHAVTHDHHAFDAVVPALSHRFRTIALDWPGHGDSDGFDPPSSAHVSRICDALEDVVEALRLPPAVFLGNSVGGTASLRLASRMPDRARALVLVDTGGFTGTSAVVRAACWVQGREAVRRSTGRAFARFYLKKHNQHAAGLLTRLEAASACPGFAAMDAAMWRSFGTAHNDLADEARAIACPTQIVWGRRDPVLPVRGDGARARAIMAHASYVELDTGHVPFVEDPEAFLGAVLPFLSALDPGSRSRYASARSWPAEPPSR